MIRGDSTDYELLAKWAAECNNKNLSLWEGGRWGGGWDRFVKVWDLKLF
jgi:hypothetical protein